MKERQKTLYYCDFCKKKSMQKPAMVIHEVHCTMNPDRECRMCCQMVLVQKPIVVLTGALYRDIQGCYGPFDNTEILNLRTAANGCPVCMLAAIRQCSASPNCDFDFKAEVAAVFEKLNKEEPEYY